MHEAGSPVQPITLGKYQLLKRIAAGGMAEIFVAKVTGISGFEKIVVVKRILPQLATNREFIQMFLDEARIAATLHHPNIVQMYDIGAVDGNYFISMEYLHGEDVRTLMKALRQQGDGLPLEHALSIVIGLSAGLHYAHEKVGFDGKHLGIVHRDVTPQNVFITYDGSIKIVDFGIAKASNRLNETRFGTLKGKIPYMSPEQCRSDPLDRRSDVYAIGIMLYELTTGYRLYKGNSEFDIMKKIVEGEVAPPTTLRPSYPKELERIVMKVLAKDKADRYQSGQELQADLEAFVRESRLGMSPIALSSFMHKVFGKKIESWREAQAAGKDLAAHLAEQRGEDSAPGSASSAGSHDDSDLAAQVAAITPGAHGELAPVQPPEVEVEVEPPRRSRTALLAAATAGLVALGVVIWVAFPSAGKRGASGGGPDPMDAAPPVTLAPSGPPDATPLAQGPADAGAAVALASPDAAAVRPNVPPADTGVIRVKTRPAGATLLVDDAEWTQRTPALVPGQTPGEHRLKLRLKGHREHAVTAVVTAGRTTAIAVDLKPDEPVGPTNNVGKPEKGELRIASIPSCEVMIDGKSRGSTPITGLMLDAGPHRIHLVNSRFGIDKTFSVEVRGGEVTKKKYDFPVNPK